MVLYAISTRCQNISWQKLVYSCISLVLPVLVKGSEATCRKRLPRGKKKKNPVDSVRLNPCPNKPWFLHVCRTSLLKKTVGKREIAHNEQFLFFPQCFLPIWKTFCYFHQICKCPLQTFSVWKCLKFVIWETERIKSSVTVSRSRVPHFTTEPCSFIPSQRTNF